MTTRFFRKLGREKRGVTATEFAITAPTLMLLIMGTFDLSYRGYVHAVLQGEVQKAGRDSALENATTSQQNSIDNTVKTRINALISNTQWEITRTRYKSFSRAGQAEKFTDTNNNGVRDAGECFEDDNGNGVWDTAASAGASGQGTSDDIVIYKASVSYPRVFPMYGLLGWSPNLTTSAQTVLRNQPYGSKASYPVCT